MNKIFEKGGKFYWLHSTVDAFETFLHVPGTVTRKGSHVRDAIDLKRILILVVIAAVPAALFGMWNVGYQHGLAVGDPRLNIIGNWWYGFLRVLPLYLVSYIVGDHYGVVIEHIATDLSRAYIASVMENAPVAVHVFDHFHVVKLMNEALDELRARVYRKEAELNGRKVVRGIRWLLLCNGDDIFDEKHKTRLENALAMNKPLAQAYYLKESLREIWTQSTKAAASQVLEEWLEQARSTKIPLIVKVANTIAAHRTGILAWYDCNISTAKVEGINNKIKVLKREAYGFRDEQYFKLRLYDLHNKGITSFLG